MVTDVFLPDAGDADNAGMSTQEPIPVRIAWGSPFKAPSVLLGVPEQEQLITDASRVTVDCRSGEVPKVFLEFDTPVEDLQFEGVVTVIREQVADPLEVMRSFLEDIDPSELEKATLEIQEMGGPQGFGEAALEVLKRWTSGKS